MLTVTNSTMQTFLSCERKYFLNQVKGYFPKRQAEHVKTGTMFHKAMEIWAGADQEAAVTYIKDMMHNIFTMNSENADFDVYKLIAQEAVIVGMIEGYPYDVRDVEGAEIEFKARYKEFLLRGKVDGHYKRGGINYLFDYKTKGSLDRVTDQELLKRNFQASFYLNVINHLCDRDEYDALEFIFIRRPSIRQKQKEGSDAYARRVVKDYKERPDFYYRKAVAHRDTEDGTWMRSFIQHIDCLTQCYEMRGSDNIERWPMRETSCGMYGRCPYLMICNKTDGWEDWYDMKGPDHHPELSELPKEETDGT